MFLVLVSISFAFGGFTRVAIGEHPPNISLGKLWWEDSGNQPSILPENDEIFLLDPFNETIFLICDAQYPVKWQVSPLNKTNILSVLFTRVSRTLNGHFQIKTLLTSSCPASFTAQCEKNGSPSVKTKVFIFNRCIEYTTASLWSSKETVYDSNILPCISSEPRTTVKLFNASTVGDVSTLLVLPKLLLHCMSCC